jgi:uncharacterized membrane protein YgcG
MSFCSSKRNWCILFSIFFLIISNKVSAQQAILSGQFLDSKDNTPLIGVGVMLMQKSDTTKVVQTSSDGKGEFVFKNLSNGDYKLKTFYVGYKKFEEDVIISSSSTKNQTYKLNQISTKLKALVIEEKAIRSVLKNDTTEYNASAFKVNTDANTHDLITKMPGITVEGGVVKAQGETLQKVLIDGKEFFGEDATIALKNLPAEVVDKIQVFDRLSDQSQFTGFDDGNTQKTMNITTRSGKSNGVFGKFFGGYGADENLNERFNTGGNLNFFKGKRRISLIGISNNVNQQNFSSQDLLGVTGGSGGGGGRGGFGGGGGMGGQGGGSGNNFLIGQQSGINTTSSVGLNYTDLWGKKISITGSYFFNDAMNATTNNLTRTYPSHTDTNQLYNQNSSSTSENMNHRFNLRFEYTIDTSNSIIITPKLSFQNFTSGYDLYAKNSVLNDTLNTTSNKNNSSNSGYSFSNNILLRHKLAKYGRTVSLNIGTDVNDKTGTTDLYTKNNYYIPNDSAANFDQRTSVSANGYTLSTSLNYTEPIGKTAQLMLNYSPSYSANISDKETKIKDTVSGEFSHLNTILSSKFNSPITKQSGGLSYRMRLEKGMIMAGVNFQSVELSGSQTLPTDTSISRTYNNFLPNAMLSYKFTKNSNIRMFYRTSTNSPSLSQLQTLVDNSNPLMLSIGNPNLIQSYSQSFITRYSLSSTDKGTTFFAMINANTVSSFMGNSTIIGNGKTLTDEGILLSKGSQLSKPVNLDGYWNINSFLTYGIPVKLLKSNLNFNAGYTFNRTPSLINNISNTTNTSTLNSGFVLGSNISEKIDFTITYSSFYTIVENAIQPQLNSNYFYHVSSAKINLLPWKGLVLSSDITNNYYTGLGTTYNINYFLWNAGLGYKFTKNKAAELKIIAYDLLNQNNSITRTVTGTYIEDSRTNVLKRYFMLMFTYNIRKFNAGPPPALPLNRTHN